MARKGDAKVPEFVESVVNIGTEQLTALLGTSEEDGRAAMRVIAHEICKHHARSLLYIPLDIEVELSARDEAIWKEYAQDTPTARRNTHDRVAELAVKYRKTNNQIYCILRLMRFREKAAAEAEFASRQGVLQLVDEGG